MEIMYILILRTSLQPVQKVAKYARARVYALRKTLRRFVYFGSSLFQVSPLLVPNFFWVRSAEKCSFALTQPNPISGFLCVCLSTTLLERGLRYDEGGTGSSTNRPPFSMGSFARKALVLMRLRRTLSIDTFLACDGEIVGKEFKLESACERVTWWKHVHIHQLFNYS